MFTVRILEEDIPVDKLSERECWWIEQFDSYNQGYNATTGGETSKTIHPEVKQKISTAMLGIEKSDDHVDKMIATLKGNNHRFNNSGNGKHLRVKVKAIHIQTGEELVFNSLTDLCESLHLTIGNVSRAIKNGYRVGNYKFERLSGKKFRTGVIGKCKETGMIKYQFDSVRAAGRALARGSKSATGCNKSLKSNGRYTWKGCYWYINEEETF